MKMKSILLACLMSGMSVFSMNAMDAGSGFEYYGLRGPLAVSRWIMSTFFEELGRVYAWDTEEEQEALRVGYTKEKDDVEIEPWLIELKGVLNRAVQTRADWIEISADFFKNSGYYKSLGEAAINRYSAIELAIKEFGATLPEDTGSRKGASRSKTKSLFDLSSGSDDEDENGELLSFGGRFGGSDDEEPVDTAAADLLEPLFDVIGSVFNQNWVDRIEDDTPANKKDDEEFLKSVASFETAVRSQVSKKLVSDLRDRLLKRRQSDCNSQWVQRLGSVQREKLSERFDTAHKLLIKIYNELDGDTSDDRDALKRKKAPAPSNRAQFTIGSFLTKKSTLLLGFAALAIGAAIWKLYVVDAKKKPAQKGK